MSASNPMVTRPGPRWPGACLARALGIAGAPIGSASLLLLTAVEGRLVYPVPGLLLEVTILPLMVSLLLVAWTLLTVGDSRGL